MVFVALLICSCVASAFKVRLPLGTRASSNLSVSYAVDFASLLLLGPNLTMIVAAASAVVQSTVRTARRNPLFKILFSAAVLVLTVQWAGWVFTALDGQPAVLSSDLIKPLIAAALAYYVGNTSATAAAVGLSTRQPVWRVWHGNFLWTAPSYVVGAAAAAAAASAWLAGWGWFIPLAAAPVLLTFHSYQIYLDRIAAEQRHRAEMTQVLRAARESEERYARAAAGSNDGLWDWDLAAGTFYASERWKLMIGLSADSALDDVDAWFRHVHPDDAPELQSMLERHFAGETPHFEHEYRIRHADGTDRWMLCRGVAVRDTAGRPVRLAGSQTDVSERRRITDELAHAALHDDLTGLANRALFTAVLGRSLARVRRSQNYVCAVLFVDVDHFKLINDSLGHFVGDQFLVGIAKRLLEHLRPGDLLARLGGDEFAVLLDDVRDEDMATTIASRLQATLREPFEIEGRELYASASIGIAYGNSLYTKSEELLRDADTAMYRAKALGRSQYQVFDQSMHTSALHRLTIETEMRRALEREEFSLEYQPIIELDSGDVSGFEALARWTRVDGSTIYPSEFVRIAEETGLITPLTEWVLKKACSQVAEWQRAFDRPFTLTVNISAKLFDCTTLVEKVGDEIAASGLLRGTLRLEITESFLANSSEAVVQRLDELRSIPVELYLDDFGTGFSSLSYLHRYRLDALKIDQSFISRMGGSYTDSPIVTSIVNLAKELGMGVIAEGVETDEQAKQLLALACPHAQGFLFSRPLPPLGIQEFLRNRASSPIGSSLGAAVVPSLAATRVH
jgi:diguanylate cyclase (GGDEF)-like protein/PAS domain S-box-containing protein